MNTIFCVEDDSNIRELIEYTLSSADFTVEGFENASSFFEKLANVRPDAVLLDIMLPDMDGTEILKKLRSQNTTRDIGIIMLTAKSDRMDRIRNLDMGADDYITKPFDVLELISRVKALLRRTTKNENTEMSYERIKLDLNKRAVYADGVEITLTYKEFELLHMLLAAKGAVVSRESIISKIWGTNFEGESRTLDVHIRTLRQKLGDASSHIETVRNVGYRIN